MCVQQPKRGPKLTGGEARGQVPRHTFGPTQLPNTGAGRPHLTVFVKRICGCQWTTSSLRGSCVTQLLKSPADAVCSPERRDPPSNKELTASLHVLPGSLHQGAQVSPRSSGLAPGRAQRWLLCCQRGRNPVWGCGQQGRVVEQASLRRKMNCFPWAVGQVPHLPVHMRSTGRRLEPYGRGSRRLSTQGSVVCSEF